MLKQYIAFLTTGCFVRFPTHLMNIFVLIKIKFVFSMQMYIKQICKQKMIVGTFVSRLIKYFKMNYLQFLPVLYLPCFVTVTVTKRHPIDIPCSMKDHWKVILLEIEQISRNRFLEAIWVWNCALHDKLIVLSQRENWVMVNMKTNLATSFSSEEYHRIHFPWQNKSVNTLVYETWQ